MNSQEQERIAQLLRQSQPPVDEAAPDLWPSMLQRMNAAPTAVPWFDWALLAGLCGVLLGFPQWIPLLLTSL